MNIYLTFSNGHVVRRALAFATFSDLYGLRHDLRELVAQHGHLVRVEREEFRGLLRQPRQPWPLALAFIEQRVLPIDFLEIV